MKKIIALFLFLLGAPSFAQSVFKADLVNATPAISRDDGGINSCGINFMLGAMTGDDKATLFDFSLNIYSDGYGLIKAGSQAMQHSRSKGWNFDNKSARSPGPNLVWLAKRDDTVAVRPAKYLNAENKGYVIAPVGFAEAAQLLLSTVEADPIQVSIQYEMDRIHRVMGFKAEMSKDDQEAVLACITGLSKRMRSELE